MLHGGYDPLRLLRNRRFLVWGERLPTERRSIFGNNSKHTGRLRAAHHGLSGRRPGKDECGHQRLRAHRIISGAVRVAHDNADLRRPKIRHRLNHLRTMLDLAFLLRLHPNEEPCGVM